MRLLLITFDPPTGVGGLEARARHYCSHLVRMGHQVLLVVFGRGESERLMIEANRVLWFRSDERIIENIVHVLRASKEFGADSIFFLTGGTTLFGLLMLLLTIGRMPRIVFVYGRDFLKSRTKPLGRLIFQLALLLSGGIGVNSKATARLLPRWARNVEILYPGVDDNVSNRSPEELGNTRRILFVGRLVERKGADDLLRALQLLQIEHRDVELDLVGDGPQRAHLELLAENLGIKSKVHFYGELRGESLNQRYASCSVFCMPSKASGDDIEGFGIVFLEAALFGKPTVGTWSGGIPEAVIHNETGLLVREGNINELTRALNVILSNREVAKRFGENGRRRVSEGFTWRRSTERLIACYSKRS